MSLANQTAGNALVRCCRVVGAEASLMAKAICLLSSLARARPGHPVDAPLEGLLDPLLAPPGDLRFAASVLLRVTDCVGCLTSARESSTQVMASGV